MKFMGLFRAAGCVLALVSALHAARYEVAQENPHASDEAPGDAARPWKTISRAAEVAVPGDVITIRDGIYRERVVMKTSGTAAAPIRFEAAQGEHVVVTGADRITGWRKVDGKPHVFSVPWPHKFVAWSANMAHPGNEYHRLTGRCEQVLVDGYLLRQVLDDSQLAPGTFFADVANRTLSVWDAASRDPNKWHVEASVREEVVRVEGDHVQLCGLRFRHAANRAQNGAVVLAGNHGVMEDCVVEFMNSSGASFTGEDVVVRRCVFRDNGQLGFGANHAHRLLFSECLVENNNTKGFDRGWEAGGDKLALCRDAVLERSRFIRNRGTGIWFDIGNENCTVRNCLVAENEDAGIFYEISYRLLAHDNVIIGNGFATTDGAWGAQAGISLSSSPDCVVERNLLVGNREGFNFREQKRTTRTIGNKEERPVWNHDQLIRHNIIALNRDAQVWGWFDVKDNRHWPAGNASAETAAAGERPADIAGPYIAKSDEGQPRDLTLEKLRLRFEENVYFARPGGSWFKWGVRWARHENFADLPDFQSALGIDKGGRVIDPAFADLRKLDLRLGKETMAVIKDCYPEGSVPGVLLGIRPE